jgi:hypothetical protein
MIRQFFVQGQRENLNDSLSRAGIFDKAFVFTNLFELQLSFSDTRNQLKSAVGAIGAPQD